MSSLCFDLKLRFERSLHFEVVIFGKLQVGGNLLSLVNVFNTVFCTRVCMLMCE